MEDNKYYIPDISDLHINYQCEIKINHGYESFNDGEEIWKPITIGYKTENGAYTDEIATIINEFDDGMTPIRVKYLDKEDIESEGWEFKNKSVDLWFELPLEKTMATRIQDYYSAKAYKLLLQYGLHDKRLKISADFNGSGNYDEFEILFEGECKSINELRKIQQYLKINTP